MVRTRAPRTFEIDRAIRGVTRALSACRRPLHRRLWESEKPTVSPQRSPETREQVSRLFRRCDVFDWCSFGFGLFAMFIGVVQEPIDQPGALAQPACPRPSSDPRKFCNLSRSTWHPPSAARTNNKATPQYSLQFRADHRIPVPLEILACKPVSVACELSLWSRLRRPPGNGFWTPETKGPKPPPSGLPSLQRP